MAKHFNMQTSILGNVGQFWNFAAMLACGSMEMVENNPSGVTARMRAQLPGNNLWVCYTEFAKSRMDEVMAEYGKSYSSSTASTQAAPFLYRHLDIEMSSFDEGNVLRVLTKDGGACVVMQSHIHNTFAYVIEVFKSHDKPYNTK